jgi:hypothetical protein
MDKFDTMDMKFREFLLIILDDLSELDRCRLNFVLGKHIPRRLRELNNIENTIHIFEYLIDTGKIVSCLSEGLSACGKLDWSEKLKGKLSVCSLGNLIFVVGFRIRTKIFCTRESSTSTTINKNYNNSIIIRFCLSF